MAKEDGFVDPAVFLTAPKPEQWLGTRHLQCVLLFLAILCCYSQNIVIAVSIVAMTDKQSANPDFPEYDWDESTKGVVLSSFFWGYVITQIPVGILAQIFGAKYPLLICVGVSSICAIFTPGAAAWGDWGLVCALRVVQGLAQGSLLPCLHCLLAKWAPSRERGTLVTSVYAGGSLGTVLTLPVCGLLATSAAGWPSTFYVFGGLGLGWSLLWVALGSNSPAEDRLISVQERAYIEDSLRTSDKPSQTLSTPWCTLMTSLPMWAINIAACGNNWGFWTLINQMPTFLSSVLGFDLQSNGLISALPYLAMFCLNFVVGRMSDYVTNNNILTKTASRKLFTGIGFFSPAVALVLLGYCEDPTLSISLLTLAVGLNSALSVGFFISHIDLAPNYAGTMMGVSNSLANVMGIVAPIVAGAVVTDSTSADQWRILFFISAALYVIAGVFYSLFGSAQLQWWNDHATRPPVGVYTIPREKYRVNEAYAA